MKQQKARQNMAILYKLFKTKGRGSFFIDLRNKQRKWNLWQWIKWWKVNLFLNN